MKYIWKNVRIDDIKIPGESRKKMDINAKKAKFREEFGLIKNFKKRNQ